MNQPRLPRDFYEIFFHVNFKDFVTIRQEYNLSEEDFLFIKRTFWPIVQINIPTHEEKLNLMHYCKTKFELEHGCFDSKQFIKKQITPLLNEMEELKTCYEYRRIKIWRSFNNENFMWVDRPKDFSFAHKLFITELDPTILFFYCQSIIEDIQHYITYYLPGNLGRKKRIFKTRDFVITYILDCYAKGEIPPLGSKKELERIGNQRMGPGKGNRFYKVFNEVIKKDLNREECLKHLLGSSWKETILSLTQNPELLQEYLHQKKL
ncbi:hypothetical protein [Christiangramia salexigens]|uniref:Uncharacterized protein n=1 Tax=Christiangramia salexigens TaxID=1913577 RepID=A0A1L3J2I8_9FLAO|nr:hypothetical protein [Christiangramia salexigens]APG59344.1 hypothetical protein LPB144_02475 [Christiangramia salexigens]